MYPIAAAMADASRETVQGIPGPISTQAYAGFASPKEVDAILGHRYQANTAITNPGAAAVLAYFKNTNVAGGPVLVIDRLRINAAVADAFQWQLNVVGTAAGGTAMPAKNKLAGGAALTNATILDGTVAITGLTLAAAKVADVMYAQAAAPASFDEPLVIPPGQSATLSCVAGGTEVLGLSFHISERTP